MIKWLIPLLFCCSVHAQVVIRGATLRGAIVGTTNVTSGGGGLFTYTLVSHTSASVDGNASATSGAIDTSTANLIVYSLAWGSGVFSITDNKANSAPTGLNVYGDAVNGIRSNQVLYAVIPTVGSGHTFTIASSSGAGYCVLNVWAFKKSSGIPAFDTQNGFSQSSGAGVDTLQIGSVTPSADNGLIVSGMVWNGSLTSSIDSGFTTPSQTSTPSAGVVVGGFSYLIQTTVGAVNPTWSFSGNITSYGASIAAFK